jgi:hypothetical protein
VNNEKTVFMKHRGSEYIIHCLLVDDMMHVYSCDAIKDSSRPKKVPMSPNVVLEPEDTPDLPDPRKQKFYSSLLAKLQFAAAWVRFDIAFAVSQLARFCASARSSHWTALRHLMEYLAGTPSFKITYRRSKGYSNLLSDYADADW